MMDGTMEHYDPLYMAFLFHFNKDRDYFECHEVMEHLWLQEARDPLYQGLLQVAVGLYHHRNGNIDGGIKLLTAAIQKLEGYSTQRLGIHLDQLIVDAKEHLRKLQSHDKETILFRDLNIIITDPQLARRIEEYDPKDLPSDDE
jgi:predicted metal-dependent hydrolase